MFELAKPFVALTAEYDGKDLRDLQEQRSFLQRLLSETRGQVIVDFLDQANWDYFEDFSLDPETRLLTLVWRNYRNRDESDESHHVRSFVFPADWYGLMMKLQSIVIFGRRNFGFVILSGYVWKDKDISKLLKPGTTEYDLRHDHFFESSVFRQLADSSWEVVQCHTTPLYSVALLPKGIGATSLRSEVLLFEHNVGVALGKLHQVLKTLDGMEGDDVDAICEKMNTARRAFENLLKIECAYRELQPKQGYSELTIGDLAKLIKPQRTADERRILAYVERHINTFSHDSGVPITRADALVTAALAVAYGQIVRGEVRIDFYT